ncbi:histidine kinase [Lutibacter sp. TH_r2]|uniref:sensor histidine kinase n=1 Tax=Lutibacter sp. TH_r2 TaxID=3082083 RepID=UPI002953C2D1|nr:ATP-binding protein [Lutibacter sp. TH_r2]MDV7186563.1 histidine kinase [Lutibacter sp. TH_r2]
MEQTEIQILVLVVTIIVIVLAATLVVFLMYFQKKKTTYILKQKETQQRFEKEINKSKLEIQEQTLQNISWEIHDNVGQLLSVAKMQLNMVQYALPEAQKKQVFETGSIISKSLEELRGLSKSLNPETIKNKGLLDSIQFEIERFNRLNVIDAQLIIKGESFDLSNEKEIILFRILQEFCNNTLKYAKAQKLTITFNYLNSKLEILAEDNGIGFDIVDQSKEKGIGLINIKSRAELIGAKLNLTSEENKGTKLYLSCSK